jgi:hypothetical protein
MATATASKYTEAAIWARLIDPEQATLSAEAAQSILALRFPQNDLSRMHELAVRNGQGKLTPAEKEDLANYIKVGDILALLHSKARQSLTKCRDQRDGHG